MADALPSRRGSEQPTWSGDSRTPGTHITATGGTDAEGRDSDAARNAFGSAVPITARDGRVTMSATGDRAQGGGPPKRDTLRSIRFEPIPGRRRLPISTCCSGCSVRWPRGWPPCWSTANSEALSGLG